MPEITKSKYLTNAGWNDAPHLDEKTKEELLASIPPYLREARSEGIPSLGAGAIYPIPVEDISCDHFSIPSHWPRAYAFDVGWHRTAALWGAWEPTTGICYVYAEHYRGQAEPPIHAAAIKVRGDWIRGVCDPAARGSGSDDGVKLYDQYVQQGLLLSMADNAVDAGLHATWVALSIGKLKVMKHLLNFYNEYRLYRRDENGRIVKKHDHLMDCMRYLVMSGRGVMRVEPVKSSYVMPGYGEPVAGY